MSKMMVRLGKWQFHILLLNGAIEQLIGAHCSRKQSTFRNRFIIYSHLKSIVTCICLLLSQTVVSLSLSLSLHPDRRHYVYEVGTRNNFPLTTKVGERQVPKIQYVVWAPKVHSSSSQAIAFVYENDLYYKPKVQSDLVCRITTTGKMGVIYNGIPDWFYGNVPELRSETIAFSSDGSYLSYLSFNDTWVNEYK